MSQSLDLTFADGARIHIEGSATESLAVERGLDATERVTEPFEAALGTVRRIADGLNASLNAAVSKPDTVTVTFGLNFSVESGAMLTVLTKGAVGANLEITMEWKKA